MENLGIFYDHLVFLRPLEICYGHLVYFVVICYIFHRFGIMKQEKSGNPVKADNRIFYLTDFQHFY
jgi:hypothetical protein